MVDPGEGSPFRFELESPSPSQTPGRWNHTKGVYARRKWKRVYYKIRTLIGAKLRWHRLGRYLQVEEMQDLSIGLERCKGVLARKTSAAYAKQRSKYSKRKGRLVTEQHE